MIVALAVALSLQDAGALIRGLGDESPEKRDAALDALIELGPPALPGIEAALASSRDPEVLARLAQAKERIALNVKLHAVLGPVARVTVKQKDVPLEEMLAAIKAQGAGDAVLCDPALRKRRVTLDVAKKPFFEALQALCAQNEGFYLEVGEELRLRAGKSVPAATVCAGPFVFQAQEFTTTRPVGGGARRDLELLLTVRTQSNVKPLGGWIALDGFTGGSSEFARSDEQAPPAKGWFGSHRLQGKAELPSGAAHLDLTGQATFHFAVESKPWDLKVPTPGEPALAKPLDDARFELSVQFDGTGERVVVELEFTYAPSEENEVFYEGYKHSFRRSCIQFFDAEGKAMKPTGGGSSSGSSSGGATSSREQGYSFDCAKTPPSTVRVVLPKTIHTEVVPISLKGVPVR